MTCRWLVVLGMLGVAGCQVDKRALQVQSGVESDPSARPSTGTGGTPGTSPRRDAARPIVSVGIEDAGAPSDAGLPLNEGAPGPLPTPGATPPSPPAPDGAPSPSGSGNEALDGSAAPPASSLADGGSAGADGAPAVQRGEVLVHDPFEDRSLFFDLSTLVRWGDRPAGTSAFTLISHQGRRAIALEREATRFSDFRDSDSLRTFSAIDYRFPRVVPRRGSRLRVEFDATWDGTTSSGEAGRFTIALLHEYPQASPRSSDVTRRSGAPFARPTYTLRLLNGPRGSATGEPFIQYGGGQDLRGTFDMVSGWWLPGFLSAPGGGQPGAGDPWPRNGWVEAPKAVGATTWRRFALVVEPHRVFLEADGTIVVELPTPESAPAPMYQYFDRLEALRIAWRGVENGYLANLTVRVENL